MVRFILDKGNREHIGQTEFIQINCTNIDNRVKQIGLNIVHKLYYLKKPEYLLCNFIRTNNSHSHNTRNSPFNFKIPMSTNNTVVPNSFSYNMVKAWNVLPNDIKNITGHQQFKLRLKRYLINQCV